jgi:hypothetical protein
MKRLSVLFVLLASILLSAVPATAGPGGYVINVGGTTCDIYANRQVSGT